MAEFDPLELGGLSAPRYVAPSTWILHVPFAMYLMEVVRPRVFVELGTFYGVSYCAFCQAAQALGTGSRCFAVDTWQGDPHAGFFGDEVLAQLRSHHDPLYGTFSRLMPMTFDAAAAHFEPGSVDLLHIDGFHTYEAVKRDFERWLPRMSPRGVVVFHDIAVREKDFGVWRLWDELKARHPHYEVEFGYGLGVVAVGDDYPRGLDALFAAPPDELARIREYFRRLGTLLLPAQELDAYRREVRAREAAETARREALRGEHPLLARAAGALGVWMEQGLGAAARQGLSSVRRRLPGPARQEPGAPERAEPRAASASATPAESG